MNKIQELIDNQTITLDEVLNYALSYELNQSYYDDSYECFPDDEIYKELTQFPNYVVASTNRELRETYVFPATAEGELIRTGVGLSEVAAIAERYCDENWDNADEAVKQIDVPMRHRYVFQQVTFESDKLTHSLYKKEDIELGSNS